MNEPSKYTLKSTPLPPSLPSLPSNTGVMSMGEECTLRGKTNS